MNQKDKMSISPLLYILISTATGTPKRRRKPERITTTEVSNNLTPSETDQYQAAKPEAMPGQPGSEYKQKGQR